MDLDYNLSENQLWQLRDVLKYGLETIRNGGINMEAFEWIVHMEADLTIRIQELQTSHKTE